MNPYKIEVLGLIEYYKTFWARFRTKFFQRTDAGYPFFLALGYCSGIYRVNSVAKIFNWRLRLLHEIGHECYLKHTNEKGHIMHPLGIFRGIKGGKEIIKEYVNKYGIDNMSYSFEQIIAGEPELIEYYKELLEGETKI